MCTRNFLYPRDSVRLAISLRHTRNRKHRSTIESKWSVTSEMEELLYHLAEDAIPTNEPTQRSVGQGKAGLPMAKITVVT